MALMGSDQARMGQNDQARAVLEWLSSEGAQNLLRQVSADRAQRADQPDIPRGQEEVQRRRDDAVHDWLNTPEAQRFLMGREDADIAMRQQGQRGPGGGGAGYGPPAGASGRVPGGFGINEPASRSSRIPGGFGIDPRTQMLEQLMAAGAANPDFGGRVPGGFGIDPRTANRGPYNPHQGGSGPPRGPMPRHPGSFGPPQQAPPRGDVRSMLDIWR